MGRLALEDVAVQDVFFATARAAGFPESRIHIHGISDLPLEPIEVVVPIRGITVASPRRVGRVDFLPPHLGHRALDAFRKLPPEFAQEFRAAPAYATVVHTSQRLYDAEVRALEDVDIALAWLCVRARYGLARLPDGHAQAYLRDDARSLPERAELWRFAA